jgi:hypothetical protein
MTKKLHLANIVKPYSHLFDLSSNRIYHHPKTLFTLFLQFFLIIFQELVILFGKTYFPMVI